MKNALLPSLLGALALTGMTGMAADLRNGLVSYWPFDTVDLLNDLTPDVVSGNNLILNNISDTSVLVPGKFGHAFSFNAGAQQIAYFTSPDGVDTGLPISASAAYSILLWVNGTGDGQADLRYFCESSTLNNNPLMAMGSQQYGTNAFSRIFNRNGAGTVLVDTTTTNAVLDGTWHHIAEVYNAGAFSVYVDGQLSYTNSYNSMGNALAPIDTTAVGGIVRAAVDHWLTCEVDDLAVWSRALTQSEIQNVMTNSIQTPVPQFAPGISVDPLGATNLLPGDAWTFNAGATGTRPLAYQWTKGGTNIAGATTTTLALTNLASADAGSYAFVVTNAQGSITSAVAALVITSFSAPNITNGLVAYWPLDTVVGSKTPDLVSGYDMTLVNMTAAGNLVPGKWGNAFSFTNATHTILQRVDNPGEDLPIYNKPSFTISMWVNGDPNQTDRRVWSEGSTANNNPLFNLGTPHGGSGGNLDSFVRNNSGTIGVGTTPPGGSSGHYYTVANVFDDTWHNIVYVQRVVGGVTNGALYVDGALDPTVPDPVWPLTLNTTTIGGILRSSASSWYSGLIDEVAVWGRALSPDEIQILQVTSITNPPSRLQPLAINSFLSDLPAVVQGGSTVLRWDVSKDAAQVTITPTLGDVTAKTIVGVGTNGIILTNTTTFALTVTRGVSSITATTTVAVVSGVAPGWALLDNFDTYAPGPLNATPWWKDLRGNSVQIASLNGNPVMTTLAADSDALLNLQTNTIRELQLGTLFFRMILPTPGTTTPTNVVCLTDINARAYGDIGFIAPGGTGPAVFPCIMVDPVGGTNAWFLGARNGIGAGIDFTAAPLIPGAVYDVWMDITNAPMNDPVNGFISDTFSVYLQREGDPTRTLVFNSYASDRDPNYVDVILGGMQPNLDKLIVAGADTTISPSFDDFYLSSGAYLAGVPRAFGFTGGQPQSLQISRSGSQLQIHWTTGTLQQAPAVTGPWSVVPGAAAPTYTVTPAGAMQFFRAQQ